MRAATTAQVLVADVAEPQLDDVDRRHLVSVLRIRDGEKVSVTDGSGRWAIAVWRADGLIVDGPVNVDDAPAPSTVAFALTKGDKPELVVQKLTEVGVGQITPFVAERSVVRWDADKKAKNVERLRRISEEAAMQSRRVFLPRVDDVLTTADVAAAGASAAQFSGSVTTSRRIAVGPEGGWAPSELQLFAETVDLGPTVLRAETAAIVAGVRVVEP